jgi:hypothetical protein
MSQPGTGDLYAVRVPRPRDPETPEDAARAERVAELYQAWRRAEVEYKEELARTAKPNGPVSVTYLADVIGIERKTVYRHLGRSMT